MLEQEGQGFILDAAPVPKWVTRLLTAALAATAVATLLLATLNEA